MRADARPDCFVEVKNVTLFDDDKASFPDARTERGLKHLKELVHVKKDGRRAVVFFLIHRDDVSGFAPATEIDPDYAEGLVSSRAQGVEVLAYCTTIRPPEVRISRAVKLDF